jgi:hypothetical protein
MTLDCVLLKNVNRAFVFGLWTENLEFCLEKFYLLIYLFYQQSEYNVFHKLMTWQESSLWTGEIYSLRISLEQIRISS